MCGARMASSATPTATCVSAPRRCSISIDAARDHVFGYCLLNDWSAKSIQWFEQVLGPFLGKSFHSSLSPWLVTSEALAPFRKAPVARGENDPPLMAHL